MSLTLIGMGLFDEKDLSLRAIDEAKKSDKVYVELYTNKWHGSIQNMKSLVDKEITQLKRKDMEENSGKILEESIKKKIAIFVGGDPLIATTHSSLILDARKQGVKTKIIHNASIISAICETGLHVYKFGPTVTIPFPEKTKGKQPESVFEIIAENRKRGLHTLCLLDVLAEEDRYMAINEGLNILLSNGGLDKSDKIIVFAKAGSDKPMMTCAEIGKLIKRSISDVPAVIIVPGKLHFTEREYIERIVDG